MSTSKSGCCVVKRSMQAPLAPLCNGRTYQSNAGNIQAEDSGVHLEESPVLACTACGKASDCCDCSVCHQHANPSKLSAFAGASIASSATTTTTTTLSSSPSSALRVSVQSVGSYGSASQRLKQSSTTSYISSSSSASTGSDVWMTSSSSSRLCQPSAGTDDVGSVAVHSRSSSTVTVKIRQATAATAATAPTVVEFSVGPVEQGSSDGESTSSIHGGALQSAPISSGTRKTRDSRGDDHKMRFKKLFAPLRRSHSAGNKNDMPAYSLFKRRETSDSDELQTLYQDDRCSVDAGRSSLDPSSSDRDCEETHHLITVTCRETKKKSLTTEVKEKFHVFRRRYTDIALLSKEVKTDKMSLESVRNWGKSFDVLLADKNGLHCFREFLKSEFSNENIEFWIACEEYKHLKTNSLASPAQKIFAEFVAYQAPREINIDSKTRETTYSNMAEPDSHAFDMAQRRIQALMDKDSYPRFLESDVYLQLVGTRQKTAFT